jgi:drug/metabolite transporter (DMT)-like permease
MLAIALALAASLGWGSGDFLGGLSAKRLPILVVAALSQAVGLGFTLLVVLAIHRGPLQPSVLWIGGVAGLLGAAGLSALYRGLAVGRMGVVAPVAALSGLVPITVGLVAQGDRPEAVQVAGMVLAIGGVVLAARARDAAEPGRRVAAGLGLGLLAALFLGMMVVALDAGGDRDAVWTIFMVRVSSVTALWLILAALPPVRRPSFEGVRPNLGVLAGAGVLDNLANLLFVLASARGLLSVVSVIGSLYPVVTVILARIVLDERLGRWQLVGVVGALAGVALISLG